MIQALFDLLCGLLYLVGYPLGWTYQETSIYVCIYLWPIICCVSVLPIIGQTILLLLKTHRWWSPIPVLLSLVYLLYYVFYTNIAIERYGINVPNAFNKCMVDITFIAQQTKMSYAEVSILIYVVLFLGILLINFAIFKILKRVRGAF